MLRLKSRAGCKWDLALHPPGVESEGTEKGRQTVKTGLATGKQIQALDPPLESFVICAQGVCSFFGTAKPRHTDKGELLYDEGFFLSKIKKFRGVWNADLSHTPELIISPEDVIVIRIVIKTS